MDSSIVASALTRCDQEPIHMPGAILPHGAMLVLDDRTLEVLQAAGDCTGLLGRSVHDLLDTSVSVLFDADQTSFLRSVASSFDLAKPRHLLDPLLRTDPSQPLDASLHRSGGALVLEFERADCADRFAADPLSAVREMIEAFDDAPTTLALCQLAAERVRSVTGYDRVMVYRFMEDASGAVIAECRAPHVASFLGLHYPAGDIPVQARALYAANWLRLIAQIEYAPAPLLPPLNPRTGRPLDMSQATLRDVSPIHRDYLRNMGVSASMSISIVRDGRLWGLIACHHYRPRRLPRHLRAACELFGSMLSLQLEACEKAEQLRTRLAGRTVLQHLVLDLTNAGDYPDGLTRRSPNLLDYIDSGDTAPGGAREGGVAVIVGGRLNCLGTTPSASQIDSLVAWLDARAEPHQGVFSSDRLSEIFPPAASYVGIASGLLAISVSPGLSDYIIWFRPELVSSTWWAGEPSKPAGPTVNALTPRTSFAAWQETVRGRSVEWSRVELDAAADLRTALLDVVLRRSNLVARERAAAAERDRLLMAELDHRVKNTLANIQALVSQTSRSTDNLIGFVEGLDGRIHSMAKTHSLLSESRWEGVSIERLITGELGPYDRRNHGILIEGPGLVLTSKAALALSLAVHELATNAAKYGALSAPGGRVSVVWALGIDSAIALDWRESGGPLVTEPTRFGFGSTLIERALAMETGGRATLSYAASGVRCAIVLPGSAIARVGAADIEIVGDPVVAPPATRARDTSRRVLVVEDSFLLLATLEQMFDDLGWIVVGPATRVAEALALARSEAIDVALLDINLDGEMSWEVARTLRERRIPVLLCSGYDAGSVLPPELLGVEVIGKPFRRMEVEDRLSRLLAAPEIEGKVAWALAPSGPTKARGSAPGPR